MCLLHGNAHCEVCELKEKNHRLAAELEACKGELARVRAVITDIKEELEYDISNGNVALELAQKALAGGTDEND